MANASNLKIFDVQDIPILPHKAKARQNPQKYETYRTVSLL